MAEPLPDRFLDALGPLGLDPSALDLAAAFAAIPPALAPEDRSALAALAILHLKATAEGHTRLALEGPGSEEARGWAALLLGAGTDPADLAARASLAVALGDPGAGRPFVRGHGPEGAWLTSLRLERAEARVATAVRTRAATAAGVLAPLPEGILADPVRLSAEQAEAVARACSARLTLVTGGPGTGKTSILAALLRGAVAAGMDPAALALAAPTGKAAQRMGESLRQTLARIGARSAADERLEAALPEPQTLHRLLAWLPSRSRFRHHRRNPLPHRLVIVDEASMIGLELMEGLLEALSPETALVLLGDAGQLPSVEPGAVFRDLVDALPGAAVRLTRSYRMDAGDPAGRSVLGTAQALRGGTAPAAIPPDLLAVRSHPEDLARSGAEWLPADLRGLKAFLADWLVREVLDRPGFRSALARAYRFDGGPAEEDVPHLEALFQAHERARLLCLLRSGGGLASVEGLNAFLHARMQGGAGGETRELPFLAGEPVLVTVNDYRHGLFNGDQGVVIRAWTTDGLHQAAVFRTREGFRGLPLRTLRGQVEPAFALTVHKAQGSEFDRIALVLPDRPGPLHAREVVYTALTRARTSATILAAEGALEAATRQTALRHTGLAARLA